MLGRSSRSSNFFRKLVVNGVSNSKVAIQNDCLMRLYDADGELKAISSELDSFDGKKDPIRCNLLVNQLRTAQDKVISLLFQLMDDCNCERASKDYRMKFPDEILLSEGSESLNGQIWFGAECLSAGSNILNHAKESTMLRPMAKTLTTNLDSLRNDLRNLVIDGGDASRITPSLIKKMVAFDHIFANFEYEYVRTMLPIRTVAEIEKLQEVAVLFSETLIDCVKRGLVKQEDIDEFEPIVMIAIPRLAIVRGLLYKSDNPIYTRHKSHMCTLFQPFHGPLHSTRRLLRGLSQNDLFILEKMLANDQSALESAAASPNLNIVEINKEQRIQTLDDSKQQTLNIPDLNEPGTSNTYSNFLMGGLQYPVGHKRATNDDTNETTDHTYDCNFDAQPSSSKTEPNSQVNSPIGSAYLPSSSMLSEEKSSEKLTAIENESYSLVKTPSEPNDQCSSSPQTNDMRLDRMVEDSISCQATSPSKSTPPESMSADDPVMKNDTSQSTSRNVTIQSQDGRVMTISEAILEDLYRKQTQILLRRLFVSISGVADQLQSNFASDLRFILRHIFSTEDEDEVEEEDTNSDDSNNELSDSSLPIEQGIEAQEVADLIDLEAGYSFENTYDYDPVVGLVYNPSSINELEGSIDGETDPYSQTDHSVYGQQTRNSRQLLSGSESFSAHTTRNSSGQMIPVAGYDESLRPPGVIYNYRTSPNEASIMEDQIHQQLTQQNLQSLSRSTRPTRSHRTNTQVNDLNVMTQSSGDRRSRHSSHGSRSRRPRGPPVWVPDQLVIACSCCNSTFTLFRRRHHCRACGQIFCAECSRFTKNLNCWGYKGPVRVCESCFNQP